MSYKILLSGYFGFDNVGDEAILHAMVKGIKNEIPEAELVALSANPEFTARKNGIRAIDRMSIFSLFKELKDADLFISGGGSLFQDVTSKRSMLYYLAVVYIAKKLFKKKVMIYSQGIGPVIHEDNRKKLAKLFNQLDIINVRDENSKNELISMGVTKNIEVTTDTVFSLNKPDFQVGKDILEQNNVDTKKLTLGISMRSWKDCTENIIDEIAKMAELFKDKDMNIVLLPFHFPHDLEISERILAKTSLTEQDSCKLHVLKNLMTEEAFLSVMVNMDIVLSMRLHGLIFATVCNAYPIAVSYDPKVDSLFKEMKREVPMDVKDIDAQELYKQILSAMENIDELKEKTSDTAEYMKEKALKNNKMVKELLKSENFRN